MTPMVPSRFYRSLRRIGLAGAALTALGALMAFAAPPHGCDLKAADAAHAGQGCAGVWMDHNLKLNDVLAVGTHNSYKTAIPPAVFDLIRKVEPDGGKGLDYGHPPLDAQLDEGARQLEIDVYYDPKGGRFAHPVLPEQAGIAIEPWRRAAWAQPGYKVMHVPDEDVLSSCPTLIGCLQTIRQWSLAHPGHVPIMLMFNTKDDQSAIPGGTGALPYDEKAYDALDKEIRSVFPPEALITPDDVQGHYPTLRDAVLHDNWPTLGQARGKVIFAMDEGPEKVAIYRGNRPSLQGRVFFINTDETSPAAGYITLNDPIGDAARIKAAVAAGFLVRTRADEDTIQSRTNDPTRRTAALASGAQFVSTDYMHPDLRFSDYTVKLPDGATMVCNPVRAAAKCAGLPIETKP